MNSKIGASNNDTPKFVARYIENFIDLVENIPNDLSRRITRVHELQLDYESSLSKLESNLTKFSNPTNTTTITTTTATATITQPQTSSNSNNHSNNKDIKQLKLLLATQHCLVKMQEISDNKLAIIQDALDQLDGKSRELDHDFKLINAVTSDGLETNNSNSNTGTSNNNGANNSATNHANSNSTSATGNTSKGAKNNINNKHQSSSASHHQPKLSQRESPEPTYCVCHQVSYGDMICCDNDACDIEWFHFQCVSLTFKPKGKWYCPNCRGDRSNQPKK